MIPTLVGFNKLAKMGSPTLPKDDNIFFGFDALKRSPLLSLKYPVEHGIILDWEEITLFLEHCF